MRHAGLRSIGLTAAEMKASGMGPDKVKIGEGPSSWQKATAKNCWINLKLPREGKCPRARTSAILTSAYLLTDCSINLTTDYSRMLKISLCGIKRVHVF